MKNNIKRLFTIMMLLVMTTVSISAMVDKRIRLKNGKGEASTTLNPSRTYRLVISGKQFKKLSIKLRTGGAKIQVVIKSPSGKTITSSTKKNFTVRNIGSGDYQIILKNLDKSKAAKLYIKIGDIKGE